MESQIPNQRTLNPVNTEVDSGLVSFLKGFSAEQKRESFKNISCIMKLNILISCTFVTEIAYNDSLNLLSLEILRDMKVDTIETPFVKISLRSV